MTNSEFRMTNVIPRPNDETCDASKGAFDGLATAKSGRGILPLLRADEGAGCPFHFGLRHSSFVIPRSRGGFSLLEVIAAMTLIIFLMGGVYGIADGTLRLGASMGTARVNEARLMNFTGQWRSYLENLPAGTRLTAGAGRTASKDEARLLFENGGAPFAWSRAARAAAAVEIAVVRESTSAANLVVRHLKRAERASSSDGYFIIAEMPLLQGVQICAWEFCDPVNNVWTGEWKETSRVPSFMRLRWQCAGEAAAHEEVFWISGEARTDSQNATNLQPADSASQPAATKP